MKTARQWGEEDECVQALHSSGCLKGKAKPLSMAAILMQDSEQLSGHSASYNERRRSQLSPSQPDFGDGWPTAKLAADHSSTTPPVEQTGEYDNSDQLATYKRLRVPSSCNLAALRLTNTVLEPGSIPTRERAPLQRLRFERESMYSAFASCLTFSSCPSLPPFSYLISQLSFPRSDKSRKAKGDKYSESFTETCWEEPSFIPQLCRSVNTSFQNVNKDTPSPVFLIT